MSAPHWLRLTAILSFVYSPVAAQQTGGLRGVVFDSLANAPLSGARVWARGTTATALTDDHGAFVLHAVPAGVVILSFSHDALDSIGVPHGAARATVIADSVVDVGLFVPSLARFRGALCGDASVVAGGPGGILFGAVSETGKGARVAGARVEAHG